MESSNLHSAFNEKIRFQVDHFSSQLCQLFGLVELDHLEDTFTSISKLKSLNCKSAIYDFEKKLFSHGNHKIVLVV